MIVPNLVIAGAPKCATTAVFDYLAVHPDVCPASVKETYFLMDEGYPLYRQHINVKTLGLPGYGRFFQACEGSRARYRVEATPDYMYQHTALRVLAELPIRPLVLFVLRKPSERVYSLYRFAQNNIGSLSKRVTFAQFIDDVRGGRGSVKGQQILEQALEQSKYAQYLEQWYGRIGGDHIHVFLFEDLVADPGEFMVRLAGLLGLDPGPYRDAELAPKNATVQVRFPALQKWRRRLRRGIPSKTLRRGLGAIYTRLNFERGKRERTEEELSLLAELDGEFAAWNIRLARLTGLATERWDAQGEAETDSRDVPAGSVPAAGKSLERN